MHRFFWGGASLLQGWSSSLGNTSQAGEGVAQRLFLTYNKRIRSFNMQHTGFVPDGVFCESASEKHECPNRRIKDHGPLDSIFLLLLTKCVSLTAIWSGPLQTNDRRGVFGQVWPPSMGKVNYQSCCLHVNEFFLES